MTIYLAHEGTPTPVSDLFWMERAACGCLSGATTAQHGDKGPVTDADGARRQFNTTKALVERSIENGFTYELRTRDWFGEHLSEFTSKCPHEPKWGVAVVEAPAGYTWAAARPTRGLRHLAPTEAVADWRQSDRVPLCGSRARRGLWGADWWDLQDTVTCRRCEAKATGGAA